MTEQEVIEENITPSLLKRPPSVKDLLSKSKGAKKELPPVTVNYEGVPSSIQAPDATARFVPVNNGAVDIPVLMNGNQIANNPERMVRIKAQERLRLAQERTRGLKFDSWPTIY